MSIRNDAQLEFFPFSRAPRDALCEYLRSRGHSDQLIRWKFLDDEFNLGRERGMVMSHAGKICGFLGLTPVKICGNDKTLNSYWSFDWSKAEDTVKGAGRLLLEYATERCGHHMGFGGNEITQALYPRYAKLTVPAGDVYVRNLRARVWVDKIKSRVPWTKYLGVDGIRNIPLFFESTKARTQATIEPGISERLLPLISDSRNERSAPSYDYQHLSWLLERCPYVDSVSSVSPGHGADTAGCLIWRINSGFEVWRMAMWHQAGESEALRTAVRAALTFIHERRGARLFVLISRLDREKANLLRDLGFARYGKSLLLYVLSSKASEADAEEIAGLSYLDTDLAYRFGGASRMV